MTCIQNLLTAQFHSIFNSQTLWQQNWKFLFCVYAHRKYLLHLTVKLQRTSFQFWPSESGWNPVAGSHSELLILKYKFLGVFRAENFPPHIPNKIFMIWNTSKSDSLGTHWIVILQEMKCYTSLILSVFLFGSTSIYLNDWTRNSIRSVDWWQILPSKNQTLPCAVLFVFILHIWFMIKT